MNGGVAIFVKTPGLTPLKTRLAAGLGVNEAEAWYRRSAAAVAAAVCRVAGISAYWAVAESHTSVAATWGRLPLLLQGEGELGARMERIHAVLLERHDFALLLGADTPQLDPAVLAEAADWLAADEPRLVMGPARDGGFWLIGANRHPATEDWLRVPCGSEVTARGFRAAMARHGKWRLLPELTDVDTVADLAAMLAEMELLDDPLPEQHQLAAWSRSALAGLP
jgi:uncharacterized protein